MPTLAVHAQSGYELLPPSSTAWNIGLRVIADEVWPFESLNLPPQVAEFVDFASGLVLVTGPTGSLQEVAATLDFAVVQWTHLMILGLHDMLPSQRVHQKK